MHVAGSLNNLFYGLSNIIIERDWVVVIAQEDDAWLRTITSNLKSIDLSCDLVAPMVVSFLHFFSYGALAAAIWSGTLLFPSWYFVFVFVFVFVWTTP